MRVDSGLPDPSSTTLTAAEWQTFLKSAVQTDLYLEYTVDFPG
jgi:hypothetical protein